MDSADVDSTDVDSGKLNDCVRVFLSENRLEITCSHLKCYEDLLSDLRGVDYFKLPIIKMQISEYTTPEEWHVLCPIIREILNLREDILDSESITFSNSDFLKKALEDNIPQLVLMLYKLEELEINKYHSESLQESDQPGSGYEESKLCLMEDMRILRRALAHYGEVHNIYELKGKYFPMDYMPWRDGEGYKLRDHLSDKKVGKFIAMEKMEMFRDSSTKNMNLLTRLSFVELKELDINVL